MNFHNSTGLSYEAEAARLAIAAGKIETEEWSHEKSKRASRILRIGETIELRHPFMVLRLNSDEY